MVRQLLGRALASLLCALVAAVAAPVPAFAAEIGHYVPGLLNIRDLIVPEPGFYAVAYNYYYTTDRVNSGGGDEIDSITIGPGGGLTLGLDVDVDLYAFSPALIWIPDWELSGVRFGMMIVPTFANASIGASLATETGRALDADHGQFDVGDLFVQPLWFGYSLPHWDFNLGFGFFAPVGKYDTETVTFPVIGTRTVEAVDNIGYGFWTQQSQAAVTWYPFDNKGTAVVTGLTYEHHFDKQDFDLTPGSNLSLNWGISQYLPLTSDQHTLLEVGPWGYSSWQVSKDTGANATPGDELDEVHGVGAQLGLTYVPWLVALNAHYAYEYHAEDRFQGHAAGISLAIGFAAKHGAGD